MEEFLSRVKHNGFSKNTNHGVVFFTVDKISELGIIHGFTSRIGGVSPEPYKSLNLSKTRENNKLNKLKNFNSVAKALNLDFNSLTMSNPNHGNNVYILNENDKGAGITTPCKFDYCDALITDNPNLTAVTSHADCTPVFVVDSKKRAVSVAHAGWKGTVAGLISNLLNKMKDTYSSDPKDIIVAVGPHIMSCCFEIKEDTAEKFRKIDGDAVIERGGLLFGNLQFILLKQLYENEISPENIICADMCTFCEKDLFYSYRRDRGLTGAMGAFINVGKR